MAAHSSHDSKARLMDAALEMFLEQGGEDLKVAEVAKRAGVSVGTFYIYFHNLRSLLIEAISRRNEEVLSDVFGTYVARARMGQPNGPPVLARLLTAERSELEPLLLFALQASSDDPDMRTRLGQLFARLHRSIVDKVQEAVDHGIMRADTEALAVGTIVFMTMMGAIVTRAVMEDHVDCEAITAALRQFSSVVEA